MRASLSLVMSLELFLSSVRPSFAKITKKWIRLAATIMTDINSRESLVEPLELFRRFSRDR